MPESWHLLVHPDAIVDARGARGWYLDRSESVADGFVAELDNAINQILAGPLRWPIHIHNTRRFLFDRYPHYVVYRIAETSIQIIAIQHARQQPGYWSKRSFTSP